MKKAFIKLAVFGGFILLVQIIYMSFGKIFFDIEPVSASTINIPISETNKSTPSIGDVNALVFKVNFQDLKYTEDVLSADEIENTTFGSENIESPLYPIESVSAYYKRASNSKLNISGKVYEYTAKHNRKYYSDKGEFETLIMEILKSYKDSIDMSDFDSDKDGYIDCLSIGVPIDGTEEDDFWYACHSTWQINDKFNIDGVKIKSYIINDGQPTSKGMKMYNSTLAHEIGHSLGLPDYYKYDTEEDWQGLKGEAGYERMDDSKGDFSAFSKLMYGWIDNANIQIADLYQKSSTYYLYPSNENSNCLIVPIGNLEQNYLSEYFLIEYITPTENNYGLFEEGGIRVFHVDATMSKNKYNNNYKSFKYENYSIDYDKSNNGKRILKLVNDGKGFYKSNDKVKFGTSNFACYDEEGNQTIDPGFKIEIGELVDGAYPITIVVKE